MSKKILIYMFVTVFTFPLFAQDFGSSFSPQEQQEMMKNLELENPQLYKLQKRMQQISETIAMTVLDYSTGKINRKKAEEILRPLLKEQIEMMENKDFLVEQQLFALLSQK